MRVIAHKITSFLLVLSVMWLFYNATVNWHYHIMPNGQITVHSHIYTPSKHATAHDTPIEGHKHSDFEYKVLAQIFLLTTLLICALLFCSIFLKKTAQFIITYLVKFKTRSCISHLQLRGPPAF